MKLRNLLQKCDYFYKKAQTLNEKKLYLGEIYILKHPITLQKKNKDGTYKDYTYKEGTVMQPVEYKPNGDLYVDILGRYTSEKFKSLLPENVIDLQSFLEEVAIDLGSNLEMRGSSFVKEFSITCDNKEVTIYFENKPPQIKIEIVDYNRGGEVMEIDNQKEIFKLISSKSNFIDKLFPQASLNLLDRKPSDALETEMPLK